METVECDNCGEKLKKYPSEVSQHNFCDLDCCNTKTITERNGTTAKMNEFKRLADKFLFKVTRQNDTE